MMKLTTLCKLGQILSRCSVIEIAGELMIIDCKKEVVGVINFKSKSITVYQEYTYSKKVVRRLKSASIPVEMRNIPVMEHAANILYNPPTQIL